jgi:hypothetical protein
VPGSHLLAKLASRQFDGYTVVDGYDNGRASSQVLRDVYIETDVGRILSKIGDLGQLPGCWSTSAQRKGAAGECIEENREYVA